MGIVRTVEWSMSLSPDEADRRLREAVASAGMQPEGHPGAIRAKSSRSMMRNRWAAEVSIDLVPLGAGTCAICKVDMLGNKHFEVLDEIAETVGDDVFDDGGIQTAIERLGKASRIFGRKEVRHLRHLIRAGEKVEALGQGAYNRKQGIIVLTDQRLFFFEKSIGSESLEEFGLASVSSIEVGKKLGGERLVIHASGNQAEISQMKPGQGEEVARQFRALKQRTGPPASAVVAAAAEQPDPLEQIRKLSELRDAGVLTPEEFKTKKADLLDRL
jgi:hypothetical protein